MGNIDVGNFDLSAAITVGKPSPSAKLPPHLQKFLIQKGEDYVPEGSSDSNAATPASSIEASPLGDGHGDASPLSSRSLQRAMDGRHRITFIKHGRIQVDGSHLRRPSPIPEGSHEDSTSRSARSSASSSLTGSKKEKQKEPVFSRSSSSEVPKMENLGTSAEEEEIEDVEEMAGAKRSKTTAASSSSTSAAAVLSKNVSKSGSRTTSVKAGHAKNLATSKAQIRGSDGRFVSTKMVKKAPVKKAAIKAPSPKMKTVSMKQQLSKNGKQTTSPKKTATTSANTKTSAGATTSCSKVKTSSTAFTTPPAMKNVNAMMKSSNSTSTIATVASSSSGNYANNVAAAAMKTVSTRTVATAEAGDGRKAASKASSSKATVSARGVQFISMKSSGSDEDESTFKGPSPPSAVKRALGLGKKK
ncbi:unnamed protein product [Amoebophrya sp. A25]|nr:unnamed protein product [Amoebophrya sp. A25]|eukprot:GSA25T00006377001.1